VRVGVGGGVGVPHVTVVEPSSHSRSLMKLSTFCSTAAASPCVLQIVAGELGSSRASSFAKHPRAGSSNLSRALATHAGSTSPPVFIACS
jgi:hypothetical protein